MTTYPFWTPLHPPSETVWRVQMTEGEPLYLVPSEGMCVDDGVAVPMRHVSALRAGEPLAITMADSEVHTTPPVTSWERWTITPEAREEVDAIGWEMMLSNRPLSARAYTVLLVEVVTRTEGESDPDTTMPDVTWRRDVAGSDHVWLIETQGGKKHVLDLVAGRYITDGAMDRLLAVETVRTARGTAYALTCPDATHVTGLVATVGLLPDRFLLSATSALVSNGLIRRVHSRAPCEDRGYCWVHKPTDHVMRGWPVHFDDDTARAYRVCEHGGLHPDPDDLCYRVEVLGEADARVVTCDGCCGSEAKR